MDVLIAFAANLAGMLLIYSLLALALVRFSWHGRGIIAFLVTIVAAELFWMASAFLAFGPASVNTPVSYSIWFGNWLVSGFSIIILCQAVRRIPRQLEDSARLDGCGSVGIYWHVLLPLVRRELILIGFLTAMAMSLPFWFLLPTDSGGGFFPLWLGLLSGGIATSGQSTVIGRMIAGSLIATLPIIGIFFIAKRSPQTARLAK